jgi:hypothetical protein
MLGGIANILGTLAAIAAARPLTLLIERLSQPVYPDVQDDPRLIAARKLCPWPTEGECRGRAKLSERGAARTGRGPGVTHTNKHVISHHDKRASSK